MIKINLLPPGIFEARVIKRLIVLFSFIVVAIVAGCMYYTSTVNKATAGYKAETAIATDWKNKADAYKSQADSKIASIAPIDAKLQFVAQVDSFNNVYPKFYENLAQYTYHKVTYSQIAVSTDGKVTISATAPSLSDAGRYLLNMYRATDLFSNVSISGVPGYPANSSGGSLSGGGMALNSTPLSSATPALSQSGGGLALAGGQAPELPGLSSSGIRGGLRGIGAVASGISRSQAKHTGFSFTVSCTIKDPSILIPPSAPGGGSASGTPGAAPGAGGLSSGGAIPLK
ncbi:MAG: hypothetical protein ABFD64_08520 [Armatimonadota bacterium]